MRASPPSCESITRSRWVGFCYSCASAPFPAGLLGVPWTGKSCRAPRTPLRSPLRPSHRRRRARGLLAPADPSNRCGAARCARARPQSAWRAWNPRRLRPARKAGWLRGTAPLFRLPLSPSPSALPVPARFIRRNPAPPSPPSACTRAPPVRRAPWKRHGRGDPSRLPPSHRGRLASCPESCRFARRRRPRVRARRGGARPAARACVGRC